MFHIACLSGPARFFQPIPVRACGLAIKRPLARDGDVRLVQRVDEGRIIHQFYALVARKHERQIRSRIRAELEGGIGGQAQVHIVEQMDRPGQKRSCRHYHAGRRRRHCRRRWRWRSRRAVRRAVADCAVIGDAKILRGEGGRDYAGQDAGNTGPIFRAGLRERRRGAANETPAARLKAVAGAEPREKR